MGLSQAMGGQQQQGGGDLNGASSSLERAQRIAPREPQVLYRLAEVRLAQGDAAQAEQLARRGLTYASGRPSLQTGLWGLIAQARERQGDPAGAAEARQQAQGGRRQRGARGDARWLVSRCGRVWTFNTCREQPWRRVGTLGGGGTRG